MRFVWLHTACRICTHTSTCTLNAVAVWEYGEYGNSSGLYFIVWPTCFESMCVCAYATVCGATRCENVRSRSVSEEHITRVYIYVYVPTSRIKVFLRDATCVDDDCSECIQESTHTQAPPHSAARTRLAFIHARR